MKFLIAIFSVIVSINAFAQQLPGRHAPTAAQLEAMSLHNQAVAREEALLGPVGGSRSSVEAFYEWDTTGYIVMSDDDYYGVAKNLKIEIARNMPDGVTLLIYTQSTNKAYQQQLFNNYAQYISPEYLKVVQIPSSGMNGFWSRDNLPVPIFEDGQFALVDARYYYNFEPDAFFAQLFNANLLKHNYFFEGGNFMPNGKGDCLVVNRRKSYPGGTSDTAAIPDDVFKTKYGCKRLIRFKHLKGIGHIDEVVKFVNDTTVVTDTHEYKATLEQAGFTVIMLPEPDLNYETYVNSLIINDTVYVPTFNERHDEVALNVYRNLGFKVVAIDTKKLATDGQGGIHCITMGYPQAPIAQILRSLGAL